MVQTTLNFQIMEDIQLWREATAEMGLQGPEIIAFVRDQQEIGRELNA